MRFYAVLQREQPGIAQRAQGRRKIRQRIHLDRDDHRVHRRELTSIVARFLRTEDDIAERAFQAQALAQRGEVATAREPGDAMPGFDEAGAQVSANAARAHDRESHVGCSTR
jgi:hypothetical protein